MNGETSVIIPARDEELNIEGAVRSLVGQECALEIIVVDDESRDRTAEILSTLASQFPALRVLRAGQLPAGWLGKTHAAAEGASMATGDWLLFTDADTRHLPGSLAALRARAESDSADLLSISPGQEVKTWWEKAVIPLVYTELARRFHFDDVSDPRSPAAAANGQYMLIRREVYDAVGGWNAVRSEVLDDVALARRVKQAGFKILFLPGAAWAKTRMYRHFGQMWRGWTKNLFLLYGSDRKIIATTVLRLAVLACLPYVLLVVLALAAILMGLLETPAAAAAPTIGAAACATVVLILQRRYRCELTTQGFSRGLSVWLAPGAMLLNLILLNSLWTWRRGGGIEWKGRVYPVKGES